MSSDTFDAKTDRQLVLECVRENRRAQRYLYEKYSPRMYVLCLRYAKDADDAKDILQEGFITVFSKMKTYSGDGSFEGWMRRIFINVALMRLRKNDVLKDTMDVEEARNVTIEEDVLERLRGKEIVRLIAEMPIGFRTVFNMNIIEGFSHQEISEALGITEGASRSQLSRARTWLQERIKNREEHR